MGILLTSTACFPPVRYMAECLRADEILIEVQETYPKQTCRNHYRICGPNGILLLTVPVIRPQGNHTRTRDVRISYDVPWQRTHMRSISTAYNRSAFYLYYQDQMISFFEKRHSFLLDLNAEILEWVLGILRADKPVSMTEVYEKHPDGVTDLRTELTAKHSTGHLLYPPYYQPFSHRFGFLPNLSFPDLLFNMGPDSATYLEELIQEQTKPYI